MFNILVVEDDKNQRRLIEAALKRNGYNVFTAGDGSSALGVLDREQVDMIVTDQRLITIRR